MTRKAIVLGPVLFLLTPRMLFRLRPGFTIIHLPPSERETQSLAEMGLNPETELTFTVLKRRGE